MSNKIYTFNGSSMEQALKQALIFTANKYYATGMPIPKRTGIQIISLPNLTMVEVRELTEQEKREWEYEVVFALLTDGLQCKKYCSEDHSMADIEQANCDY